MLKCRCGRRARLDDVDGYKPGKRHIWYICDSCGFNYTYDEKTKVLKQFAPGEDDPLPF